MSLSSFVLSLGSPLRYCNVGSLRAGSRGLHATPASLVKVYTRTGDKGTSSLFNGDRVAKDDQVFAALGSTDELNACIGHARDLCETLDSSEITDQLAEVQSRLLDLGSSIATPLERSQEVRIARVQFDSSNVDKLESWIDSYDGELPPLRNFILPGGGMPSSALHMARAVCRRSERAVVPLVREGSVEPVVAQYLNRLSDYLFTVARVAAKRGGKDEVVYKKA